MAWLCLKWQLYSIIGINKLTNNIENKGLWDHNKNVLIYLIKSMISIVYGRYLITSSNAVAKKAGNRLVVCLALLIGMTASTPSMAATAYWECGDGFQWDDNCWSDVLNGQIRGASRRPQTGDDAFLYNDNLFDISVLFQNRDLGVILNSLSIDGSTGFNMALIQSLPAEDLATLSEIVGDIGSGSVIQTASAHSVTNNLILGNTATGVGSFSIDNLSGSASLSAGDLIVGNSGTGTLLIGNGAPVSSTNGYIANNAGSTGTVTVDGVGSFWANTANLYVGGSATAAGGSGVLNVQNGSVVDVAGVTKVWSTGTVNLSDATLNTTSLVNEGSLIMSGLTTINGDVNNAGTGSIVVTGTTSFNNNVINDGGAFHVNAGSQAVFSGAVSGAGTYTGTGTLVFNGGLLADNSAALVDVAGDMVLGSAASYAFELGGLLRGTQYDAYDVAGQMTLAGELNVVLSDFGAGLYSPALGNTFDLLTAELMMGSFDIVTMSALDPSLAWQLDFLTDEIGTRDVLRLSVVSSVPVPAAVWLFGSGLLALVGVARRKTKAQS